MRNSPSTSETAAAPVGSSLIWAPWRTAPLVSETLPLRAPLELWARAESGENVVAARIAKRNEKYSFLSFEDIRKTHSPQRRFERQGGRRALDTPAAAAYGAAKRGNGG